MSKKITAEEFDRLLDIKNEIKELVKEARDTIAGTSEADRTEVYWYAHILCALDSDHEYLGDSMVTMQDSILALEEERQLSEKVGVAEHKAGWDSTL